MLSYQETLLCVHYYNDRKGRAVSCSSQVSLQQPPHLSQGFVKGFETKVITVKVK